MLAPSAWSEVTIRSAHAADDRALARLAELDEARPPEGDALVAEVAGRPVAAVELVTGRAVADPFEPTAHAVGLLRARARQLGASMRRGRRGRRRRARRRAAAESAG